MSASDTRCAREAAPSSIDVLSPHHALGFSSLALLAGCERPARALYLLDWHAATLTTGLPEHPTSWTLAVDGWRSLPLREGTIDAAIVDLDAVPAVNGSRRAVAYELRRLLSATGRCIAVVTHRRLPRDRRLWSRYRLVAPVVGWRQALRAAGFVERHGAFLRFDGPRLCEIVFDGSPKPSAGSADAVALVLSGGTDEGRAVIDDVRRGLRGFAIEETIGPVHVRKIGKAAAFVSSANGPLVVRLPCSPIAVQRARRNHAALQALHATTVPGAPSHLIPKPIGAGVAAGQPFFVESRLAGTPREGRVSGVTWEPQAVEFITSLHAGTARLETLTHEWFQQALEPYFSNLERSVGSSERTALDSFRRILRERLLGQRLPLVRSHGDFTGGNCLYDADRRLSGIVDWELSRDGALPLLDLLQCFDIPEEYTSEGWQRAAIVFDAMERRGDLFGAPELGSYLERLKVSQDLVAPLLLAYWIDHVGERVLFRCGDLRWFGGRVLAPLGRGRSLARQLQ